MLAGSTTDFVQTLCSTRELLLAIQVQDKAATLYGPTLCALETSSTAETPYPEIDVARLSAQNTLPRTHLYTWAGLQSKLTAHRSTAAPTLELESQISEDDGDAHAFDATHRYTVLL